MRIAFLGDSLTEGAPGASYMRLLRRMLVDDELLNMGRAGDTVADLHARVRHASLERVDVAFLWIGTNDAALGAWSPWALEAFEPASWEDALARVAVVYRQLLAWVVERSPRTVCVPPVVADTFDEAWMRRVADVADVVATAAAAEPRADVLDLTPAFAAARAAGEAPAGFTIDGVHLADEGAEVVAAAFAGAVETLRGATA